MPTAAPNVPSTIRNEQALAADSLFWETLHSGNYDEIAKATEAVTAAYLQNPNDAVTAAHVGWLHIWQLAERERLAKPSPTITDHAVMARRYFQEAVALDPSDARYLGFLGSAQLAEGSIHQDERLRRQGYYTLRSAIDTWPEFNLFTAEYVMSGQLAASLQFKEGLEWQWKNLDECTGTKVDRHNPRLLSLHGPSYDPGHETRVLEFLDRPAQLRRVFPEHGRHVGEGRRLADGTKDLCECKTIAWLWELEVCSRSGRKRASKIPKPIFFCFPRKIRRRLRLAQ